ncbi:dTMP kinase [Nesterenkonia rhizosphaerae]|uniref:Thymidylate kinase n=1 Tax=Nesterenkonia rhizosphaerae TaxID=1348272 RepID=A0ABP9FXY8_9MICC
MTDQNRGLFIVLEGGDGAGKTTQLSLLEQWLTQRGVTVERTREPGGTPIGERIRALVLEHGHGEVDPRTEALLFAASRAAHVQQRILPALRRGALVLCDRYVDSSVAYQGVGRGLGAAAIAELNDWATSGLTPDLTVVLDIDPAVSRARQAQRDGGAADRMESADDTFRASLRAAFLDRAAAEPQRYLVVDAAAEPAQIHQQIQVRLQPMLKNSAVAP